MRNFLRQGEMTPDLHVVETAPVEPMTEKIKSTLGIVSEQTGNLLTAIRGAGAIGMYGYVRNNQEYRSWGTASVFGILAATDVDGKFSRFGRKLLGKDESARRPFNAYGDQLTDKALVDLTMEAIGARERENGDIIYARMVEAASTVTISRDLVTTADRIIADFQGIDTRAQKSGKLKALIQYGVVGAALSPIANNPVVRKAIGLGFLYTAKKSVESGLSLHNYLQIERSEIRDSREKTIGSPRLCPDKVLPDYLRSVQDGTIQELFPEDPQSHLQ
ncbi:hypothetical protein KDA00_01575 [Candidatus Saccharibacteria bacterium]|nr:hypothetical protein [Candidatus Saccharibacteria bacterium]